MLQEEENKNNIKYNITFSKIPTAQHNYSYINISDFWFSIYYNNSIMIVYYKLYHSNEIVHFIFKNNLNIDRIKKELFNKFYCLNHCNQKNGRIQSFFSTHEFKIYIYYIQKNLLVIEQIVKRRFFINFPYMTSLFFQQSDIAKSLSCLYVFHIEWSNGFILITK